MITFKQVYRIVIFVPSSYVEKIISGVVKINPLQYGNYDQVVWQSSPGVEQFRPLVGSTPTAGNENEIAKIPSVRVEFSIPKNSQLLMQVIEKGIIPNHPWEEPVILAFEAFETRTKAIEGQ